MRGLAVIYEVPPTAGYSKPGYSSPPGHVVVVPVELSGNPDAPEGLNVRLTDIRLWLIGNAPVVFQ